MAIPKKKISRARRDSRRSHDALMIPNTHNCSNCGAIHRPHHICGSCGYYKGREVTAARD